MVSRWREAFEQHKDLLLKKDVRSYTSRSFKQGYDGATLQPWAPVLKTLFGKTSRKLVQTEGEAAFNDWNNDLKNGLAQAARNKGMSWTMYRKEVILVLRIMAAHVVLKKKAYEKAVLNGINPRSHPSWLIELYDLIPEAEAEDDHDDTEKEKADEGRHVRRELEEGDGQVVK